MCVILVGRVTKELHETAKEQNKDGFSLFTKKLGLIKNPTDSQVKQALNDFGIWHYRIASSGKVDADNIHPFKVCGGAYLLYHNGVLGEGTVTMSDTACLAKTLYFAPLATAQSVLTALSSGQRLCLVNAKNPFEYYLYGDWKVDKGVLMSHEMYSTSSYYYKGLTYEEKAGWSTSVANGKKYTYDRSKKGWVLV